MCNISNVNSKPKPKSKPKAEICRKIKVKAYLSNSTEKIKPKNLNKSMVRHIKKVMKGAYELLDGGNGNVKVKVDFDETTRLFYVKLCGLPEWFDDDMSVDADGNEPYKNTTLTVDAKNVGGWA